MSEESPKEPKLIVDEDWKEQVQREKEMAGKGDAASGAGESGAEETAEAAQRSEDPQQEVAEQEVASAAAGDEMPQMPPASFDFLVTTLATQAMMALGQMPGPDGKPEKVQKPIAKHYIDLLGVLEEKTKGNLEANEQKMLGGILHELRMIFLRS